jgi:hypothetical protein
MNAPLVRDSAPGKQSKSRGGKHVKTHEMLRPDFAQSLFILQRIYPQENWRLDGEIHHHSNRAHS